VIGYCVVDPHTFLRKREDGTMLDCRVLVADDDRDMCLLIAEFLTGAGYAVQTVSSGREAIRAIEERRPDVILCDVRMPLNGRALLETLRKRALNVPLVVMTADEEAADLSDGIAIGHFLLKPFNLEDLLAIVRESCGRNNLKDVARGSARGKAGANADGLGEE
jgi:DNA-binding response OmpR family regulator